MVKRITRKNNTNKNKSLKKNYKQKGGNGDDVRIAETPDNFMDLIQKETELDVKTADTLSDYNINYYYSLIIRYLPCSSAKLINFHDAYDSYEYYFNNEFQITSEQTTKLDYTTRTRSTTISDVITITANYDNTYTIKTGSYFKYLTDPEYIKRLVLCDNGALLISMRGPSLSASGHALVLYMNHKNKTFEIIDSNGADTDISETHLRTSKIPGMIGQILPGYKEYQSIDSKIFACQATTHRFTGSCMIWAKLFIELILRFGLDAAKETLLKLRYKKFLDVISDEIALKYASYIHKCLGDLKHIIQDPNYIEAGNLRSLISSVDLFMLTYKKREKGNIGFIGIGNPLHKPKYTYPLKLSFSHSFDPWKLEYLDRTNSFLITRDEFNQQLVATLIKKQQYNFERLHTYLSEIETQFKTNPEQEPDRVRYVMYTEPTPERRSYVY